MVGVSPKVLEWVEFDSHSPDTDLRDRRLHDWVRGGLQRGENRGAMVSRGEKNAYQLPEATLAVKCFAKERTNLTILLRMDNTTAIYYINKLGGTVSPLLNQLTKDLWLWCMNRNITLQAVHLAGKMNVIADKESQLMKDRTDWMLCPNIFRSLNQRLGPLTVDLFASRLTNQLTQYVS